MSETVSNSASYGDIPTQLSECRFIRLGYHSKTPAAGQSGHFRSDTCNYGIDDSEIIQHIKSGANYGILPRNDILIIDCDNLEMWDLIPDAWKETFTVITGRENGTGRHLYLKSKELTPEYTTDKYKSIPLEMADCRFIRLGYHSKTPAPGQAGHFRSDTCNYAIDDTELIQHITTGNNYAVLPRNGILIIDCDSSELWDRIPAHWKESFVVTSGREDGTGRHIYLRCVDAPTSSKIIFPGDMGDIRLSGHNSYVVGPGSIHPDTGRRYTNNDNEIITVSWSELSTFIETNKGAVKKSKTQEEREAKIVAAREHRARGDSLIAEVCNLKPEDYIRPLNAKIVGTCHNGIKSRVWLKEWI